ncbi:MAG: DUF86 domain-containing protein [Thermoplasmata archaeon]|nr:DUF86 domain-containing protein [Thermoplasmata archaeon]
MKRPLEYLKHIRDECQYLLETVEGLEYESFVADETLKRSFVRSLEIIGEASRNVPENFRKIHPAVEWKSMAGMRDVLIHSYFGVDYLIVWDVVSTHVPGLLAQIEAIIESENE